MTRREAYALLFEPLYGWRDDATLSAEFTIYERLREKNDEVTPSDLAFGLVQEHERQMHLQATVKHLLANPRESDAYPDSSD